MPIPHFMRISRERMILSGGNPTFSRTGCVNLFMIGELNTSHKNSSFSFCLSVFRYPVSLGYKADTIIYISSSWFSFPLFLEGALPKTLTFFTTKLTKVMHLSPLNNGLLSVYTS